MPRSARGCSAKSDVGGWGSGRQTDRRTAEGMYRIDLAQLGQMGILSCGRPTALSWSSDEEEAGSVTATGLPYGLRLEYRMRVNGGDWQQVEELVPFRRTATPFGGHRLWFTCLKCRKRCRVLYGGPPFRCRCCHRIRYSSQSETELHRASRAMLKIVQRLDPEAEWDDLPFKPKGMHWRTYRRLAARYKKYEKQCALALGVEHTWTAP